MRIITLRLPWRRGLWVLLAAALVLGLARSGHGATEVFYHGNPDRPVVALGINVVWGTEEVPRLLAILQRERARATFFLGGQWAAAHPELARQLAQAGMELGNHGWGHRHVAQLSLGANREEITRAKAAIAAATGRSSDLYAPAYGELNQTVQEASRLEGQRIIMWSVDTIDWRKWHTPAIIEERVLSRAKAGDIVLMHPTDRTVAALPKIIAGLRRKGLQVGTVSEVLR